MNKIDHFSALTSDGNTLSVTMMQPDDDHTWFEVYADDQLIGKLHWRADTDAYMVVDPEGELQDNVASLSEAEDMLVTAAGYYITIPTVKEIKKERLNRSKRN